MVFDLTYKTRSQNQHSQIAYHSLETNDMQLALARLAFSLKKERKRKTIFSRIQALVYCGSSN